MILKMRRNHRRRYGGGNSSNNNNTRWCCCNLSILMFLLLLTIQTSSSTTPTDPSPTTTSGTKPTTTTNTDNVEEEDEEDLLSLRVIELTSTDYTTKVGDGNVWLIEFFTPWCRHCQNFAHSYASVASIFHSSPEDKIRVAKVDCSVEKALAQRFSINSYPSFYLVDGWSVYEFDEYRTESNLINFARGGYKKKEPVPLWLSPMGPMGLLQGFLIYMGIVVMNFFQSIQDGYGISPFIAGVVLCGFGMFLGICSIIMLTVITTPKAKEN